MKFEVTFENYTVTVEAPTGAEAIRKHLREDGESRGWSGRARVERAAPIEGYTPSGTLYEVREDGEDMAYYAEVSPRG